MADEIPHNEYNQAMNVFAKKFQETLKASLAKPYPFAPGYSGGRSAFGIRDMKTKTGNLYNSIEVNYDAGDDKIVVTMLDYWQFVNDGRKPGKYAPITPLIQWIKNKGLKGRNKKTGRFITNESFAWGISTNIKKFGIQKTEFYDNAFVDFIEDYENGPLPALGADIGDFFAKIIDPNENRTTK
jgi:hypothetical protein